jgi:hypothetical protein
MFSEAVKDTPFTVVEAIICFFSMWSILCLCGYHTYLISFEVSTNEDIKKSFYTSGNGSDRNENANPYDKGNICANFAYVFCYSLPPSLINLRETIPNKFVESQQQQQQHQEINPHQMMFSSLNKMNNTSSMNNNNNDSYMNIMSSSRTDLYNNTNNNNQKSMMQF